MPKVIITVTCDWDGLDYYMDKDFIFTDPQTNNETKKGLNLNQDPNFRFKKGIYAIKEFNTKFPNIPITHFICPVYFHRGDQLANLYRSLINQTGVLKDSDEIALHIHCWESTISYVKAHGHPLLRIFTMLDCAPSSTVDYTDSSGKHTDRGLGVPLGLYRPDEIRWIISNAKDTLSSNLNKTVVSFRCGGWLTCDRVFDALIDQDITHEASAIPGSYLLSRESNEHTQWVSQLWSHAPGTQHYLENLKFRNTYAKVPQLDTQNTPINHERIINHFQPKKIKHSTSEKTITEVPDTGLLADYVTFDWMKGHIDKAIALSQAKDIFISLGFHIESGGDPRFGTNGFGYIERLMDALDYAASKQGVTIEYKTINQVIVQDLMSSQRLRSNSLPSTPPKFGSRNRSNSLH